MRRTTIVCLGAAICWVMVAGAGCGADDSGADYGGIGGESGEGGGGGGTVGDVGQGTEGGDPFEESLDIALAHVGQSKVFLLETALQSLLRVDAVSLQISSVALGSTPRAMAVVSGTDDALVLSQAPAEVLWVPGSYPVQGAIQAVNVPEGYNTVSQSPDGQVAVLWYNAAKGIKEGMGPLQAVTVVKPAQTGPQAVTFTTSFEPRQVHFASDGQRAFVVTRQGISVLDLQATQDAVARSIPLAGTLFGANATFEVQFTEDGNYAVARATGDARLVAVDLATETPTEWTLPAPATDLDPLPNQARVLATLPSLHAAAMIDFDQAPNSPEGLVVIELPETGFTFAAVAPQGDRALIYSSDPDVEMAVVLDLVAEENAFASRPVVLQKYIHAAAIDPSGRWAVAIHRANKAEVSGNPRQRLDAAVDAAEGFSTIDLATGMAKLVLTPTAPTQVAFMPQDDKAFLLLTPVLGFGVSIGVAQIHLPTLLDSTIATAAIPSALLPMPEARRLGILQQHNTGRITFLNTESGQEQSITGFQLNALID